MHRWHLHCWHSVQRVYTMYLHICIYTMYIHVCRYYLVRDIVDISTLDTNRVTHTRRSRSTLARTHARTHACMHACMHACTHARMHARTHARTHACIHTRCTHARMHACTQYLHNQNSNLFEKTRSAILEETRLEVSLPHFPSHRPPRELFLCTPCTQFVTRKEKEKWDMHILATGDRRRMNFREDMRIQNIKKNREKSQAAAANWVAG